MREEIKILQKSSNQLLEKLIRNSHGSFRSSINQTYIQDVYDGHASLIIEEIHWFFPFQAELFDVDEMEGTICFIAIGSFTSRNYIMSAIVGGYIHYDSISETEINLNYSDEFSTINISLFKPYTEKERKFLIRDWDDYMDRYNSQIKFSKIGSGNDELLERILSIEDMEELDLVDDDLYVKKIKMLQKIATGGRLKDDEIPRVWAEYSIVSQITSQPVLMNKAMSIPLTKLEAQELVDSLNAKYRERIKRFRTDGKVSLLFSVTLRGHQSSETNEIVIPKLGDWRFGYTNLYSAELIFHEFAHALDTPRTHRGSTRGKVDIHKHDFVRLLDMVLVDFSDYINDRYSPSVQREQILTNNEKLLIFYSQKDKIEIELRKKEKEEVEQKQSKQKSIYAEIGLSEDSFPVNAILTEHESRKKEYLTWVLNEGIKDLNKNDYHLARNIIDKFNNNDFILNKSEITLLINMVSNASRNKWVYNLPMMEQLSASTYISKLEKQLSNLSRGVIEELQIKDDVRIRTYEEANKLKKSGYED